MQTTVEKTFFGWLLDISENVFGEVFPVMNKCGQGFVSGCTLLNVFFVLSATFVFSSVVDNELVRYLQGSESHPRDTESIAEDERQFLMACMNPESLGTTRFRCMPDPSTRRFREANQSAWPSKWSVLLRSNDSVAQSTLLFLPSSTRTKQQTDLAERKRDRQQEE